MALSVPARTLLAHSVEESYHWYVRAPTNACSKTIIECKLSKTHYPRTSAPPPSRTRGGGDLPDRLPHFTWRKWIPVSKDARCQYWREEKPRLGLPLENGRVSIWFTGTHFALPRKGKHSLPVRVGHIYLMWEIVIVRPRVAPKKRWMGIMSCNSPARKRVLFPQLMGTDVDE
jgi:hypothetical protein